MITLDLRNTNLTLTDLLNAARSETVRIVSEEGQEYILESAATVDEFEREVTALGNSEAFMQFLAERRKESGRIPLQDMLHRLKSLDDA